MNYDTHWWQKLVWHTATRWYMAELSQDIFGSWVIEQSWGMRSSKKGTTRKLYFDSWIEANRVLHQTMNRRSARGYYFVEQSSAGRGSHTLAQAAL